MIDTEVSFTSLCYVGEDIDGRVWLYRLADVENNKLQIPYRSGREGFYFENRDKIYRNDGPSEIGFVGIWNWNATPLRDNPEKDYVRSYYVNSIKPIRVVTIVASSLEDVVAQLRNGTVGTQPYKCDTIFCYQEKRECWSGVLCKQNEFQIINKKAQLNEDVLILPCYSIKTQDIYNWDDKNLRFLKDLNIGDPKGHLFIGSKAEVIRATLRERSTWSLFKSIGATKAEWRDFKWILERICDDSLYEMVAQQMKCTLEQAKQSVDDFVLRANELLDAGDIDADVLARIALNHEELRTLCEVSLSQKWKKAHETEIAEAEARITALRSEAAQEKQSAKQRLSDLARAVSSAEEKESELLGRISVAQNTLDQLTAEIAHNKALGEETVAAVRQRIEDAQNDVASFIADLSVFLPHPQQASAVGQQTASWKYQGASNGVYSDEDTDYAENWEDEFNSIRQNLARSLDIESTFSAMLSAFLYAAHINNTPLLIAGPAGREIAEIVSASIFGISAGHLALGNEAGNDLADELSDINEHIISVRGMFGKGWNDELPQEFTRLKKQVIWAHPYVEDMLIEPKGLYNYMLPVISECFVGAISANTIWPGKRADNFKAYTSERIRPLRLSAFRRLGLSRILMARLERVLSDAKTILNNDSMDKDMEVLFGIMPLCVLTGKTDVLKDTIESENGISSSVKEEAAKYIEEV